MINYKKKIFKLRILEGYILLMVVLKLYVMFNILYILFVLNEIGLFGIVIFMLDKVEYLSFICNVFLLVVRKIICFE